MKTKHTPTPWQLVDREIADLIPHRGVAWCGGDKAIIAQTPTIALREQADHNAQFITLACNHHDELVEALEFLAPRIGSMLGRLRYSNAQDAEMLPKIQSLLTKLKG